MSKAARPLNVDNLDKRVMIHKQSSVVVHGKRPTGRPKALYRDKVIRQGDRARSLMLRVMVDPTHPWHADWAPRFAIELARMCTPRLTAVEGKDGAPLKLVDVQALIFMDAIEAEYSEVDEDERSNGALPPELLDSADDPVEGIEEGDEP